MWYKAASDRGEGRAVTALRSLSSIMTGAQIKQASAAAAELKMSAFVGDSHSDSKEISFLPPR
jgi:hypothetical protein